MSAIHTSFYFIKAILLAPPITGPKVCMVGVFVGSKVGEGKVDGVDVGFDDGLIVTVEVESGKREGVNVAEILIVVPEGVGVLMSGVKVGSVSTIPRDVSSGKLGDIVAVKSIFLGWIYEGKEKLKMNNPADRANKARINQNIALRERPERFPPKFIASGVGVREFGGVGALIF